MCLNFVDNVRSHYPRPYLFTRSLRFKSAEQKQIIKTERVVTYRGMVYCTLCLLEVSLLGLRLHRALLRVYVLMGCVLA